MRVKRLVQSNRSSTDIFFISPDKPGPPGLPDITDFDENMVKLKWDPPIRDGGAPITGYIIEMKPKSGTVSDAGVFGWGERERNSNEEF